MRSDPIDDCFTPQSEGKRSNSQDLKKKLRQYEAAKMQINVALIKKEEQTEEENTIRSLKSFLSQKELPGKQSFLKMLLNMLDQSVDKQVVAQT